LHHSCSTIPFSHYLFVQARIIKVQRRALRPKSGEPMVRGLGRSVITAILQVIYPDKYGVLNNTAEAGMRQVGVWPKLTGSASFADKYKAVNEVLVKLAIDLGLTFGL